MNRIYNFSAGPSMLPEKVLLSAQENLMNYNGSGMSVMEMSHRSKVYDDIIKNAESSLRKVMNIPDNYKVLFLQGGASTQFAAVPLNLLKNGKADYVVPNITEAAFLTDMDFRTEYDRAYIDALIEKLLALGCKNVILTGVSYENGKNGVVIVENNAYSYYEHIMLPNSCHGTGDIYASAFTGALCSGKNAYDSAKIAADYTIECIKATAEEDNHWYGAKFEPVLYKLIEALK